jgi:hypothetical protein
VVAVAGERVSRTTVPVPRPILMTNTGNPGAQRGIVGALQQAKSLLVSLTATAQRLAFVTSGMPSR